MNLLNVQSLKSFLSASRRSPSELFLNPLFTDANLVHYYRMEGNANDAVGILNGTSNLVTYSAANGIFGSGAGFAGATTSNISFASPFLTGSGDFTVNARVKTTQANSREEISMWGPSTNDGNVFFYIGDDNFVYLGIQAIAGAHSAAFVNDGNWHMVTGTNTSGTCQVYIDCVISGASALLNPNVVSGFGRIGMSTTNADFNPFSGAIDDVSYFSRALSATEIAALY